MSFLPDSEIKYLDTMIDDGQYDDAIDYINNFLANDPTNQELLLMIADIQYKKGEINKASKAVDFINEQTDHKDPMALYVKGVLEMEKNHRKEARSFLLKAMEKLDRDNHEIMRCYALSEYRYGNREKGIHQLEKARDLHMFDAEIIYNLIELYLLEKRYRKAQGLIKFFKEHQEDMEYYDKKPAFYDAKIQLFQAFLKTYMQKRLQSSSTS